MAYFMIITISYQARKSNQLYLTSNLFILSKLINSLTMTPNYIRINFTSMYIHILRIKLQYRYLVSI
jgi:hypothetical protein